MKPSAFPSTPRCRRALRLAAVAVAAALAAACSKQPDTTATAASAPRYVAVARGRIGIEGGLLKLAMARGGTVVRVPVQEGEAVRKGQLLVALDPAPAKLAVAAARARLEQAQAQLKLAQVGQAAAALRAKRLSEAAAAGAGAGQSADDAREASDRLAAEIGADQAAVDIARQKLAEARYALGQCELRAPADGQVVHLAVQPGDSVAATADATVVTLLPDKPRIVRAELNESFADAVHAGMRAQVVVDDGSGGSWSAHVLRVAPVFGPDTLGDDPETRSHTRIVGCVLDFDTPQPSLRIGQRVLVRFLPGAAAKD